MPVLTTLTISVSCAPAGFRFQGDLGEKGRASSEQISPILCWHWIVASATLGRPVLTHRSGRISRALSPSAWRAVRVEVDDGESGMGFFSFQVVAHDRRPGDGRTVKF
jgi:hypothetical protein